MSSDFYFRKWRNILANLEDIVNFDIHYQTQKAHDKKRCQATLRLSSVLVQYMTVYNDIIECVNQNLQVQRTPYMMNVLKTVVARILELKSDMHKLEFSNCQFFGHGLVEHHLTTYNAEMLDLPTIMKRPVHIEAMIVSVFERTKERIETLARQAEEEKQQKNIASEKVVNWWDTVEGSESTFDTSEKLVEEQASVETLRKRNLVALIQAHEKSRQIISWTRHRNYKRELWAKELSGTAPLPAPYQMRQKAAKLIQETFRAYFQIKRMKVKDCKRDEILGLRQCEKPFNKAQINVEKVKEYRTKRLKELECEYKELYDNSKVKYLKKKDGDMMEEWRDFIRDWFYKWFEEIQFFHDIPVQNLGGPAMIIKEEIQSPNEWLEEYKTYIEDKVLNKNKTAMQIKYEKMEAKRLEMMAKREELMKKKQERLFLEKIRKNPNMHPGFYYPESKKTVPILMAIDNYKHDWNKLDSLESSDVKENVCTAIQFSDACMDAKLEMLASVESDMRNELKILKTALKNDYIRNGVKMPENIKKPIKHTRKFKIKATSSENIVDRMEDLMIRGILKEYTKIKLEDFFGDPNFAGEDLRCLYILTVNEKIVWKLFLMFLKKDQYFNKRGHRQKPAKRNNGDIRYVWWECCREVVHGFHKMLLVGPKGSGKTRLVQALASVNDAMIFELDPLNLQSDILSPVYLQQIVDAVTSCAKAVQPSVIHVKNIQKLYYSKVPEDERDFNLDLIKRYIIKRLLKKFHKTDKITVIGSCENPWVTKSKQLLKQFPTVMFVLNTTYSTVVQLLKEWVLRNPVIPKDFDVNSLAYVLQGYSYGYLEESLQRILCPERIIRIAAYGLTTEEMYDFIMGDELKPKPDYDKYLKWYSQKTSWGKKEKQHIEEQQEFMRTLEKFAEKAKKKHSISVPSSNSSSKTMILYQDSI